MDTHPTVLSDSYPMNTNKARFRLFKMFVSSWLGMKIASALEGFKESMTLTNLIKPYHDRKWSHRTF